jgi:DNA-binding NtrC family response regulator
MRGTRRASRPSVEATNEPSALLTSALASLASSAIVLDASLRVVATTRDAERMFGGPLEGAHVVKVLGEQTATPLGEALSNGRAVATLVTRPRGPEDERLVRVRATPLASNGAQTGWLLTFSEEPHALGAAPEQLGDMWARDPAMKRLFALATKVAQCEAHVFLDGEAGTGKASLASAIHGQSARKNGPLREFPCASATNDAFEHVLLSNAAGVELTLFLDEVTELPPSTQGRLLRVLDGGAIAPLDGSAPQPVDVRIIAATRTSLNDEIARGRFRADLAYKLRVVSLHLPPLRSRRGDVSLLVEKFVETLNARGGRRVERVAPAVMARLERHDWPGNVRELRSVIESAFTLGDGPVLIENDLPREILVPHVAEVPMSSLAAGNDETARIRRALESTSGDRLRAAAILGMSRTTLWRRMRSLGLLQG